MRLIASMRGDRSTRVILKRDLRWEATKPLKADERTKHIPVVALTGHALAGASEGARKAGCDSFVTKPCLPDDLVVEVRRMLSASKGIT